MTAIPAIRHSPIYNEFCTRVALIGLRVSIGFKFLSIE